jgi:hypothetical protein
LSAHASEADPGRSKRGPEGKGEILRLERGDIDLVEGASREKRLDASFALNDGRRDRLGLLGHHEVACRLRSGLGRVDKFANTKSNRSNGPSFSNWIFAAISRGRDPLGTLASR